jgi:beta-mannosidase
MPFEILIRFKIIKRLKFVLFALLLFTIFPGFKAQVYKQQLNDNWKFCRLGSNKWYSAIIPGSIHNDLYQHNQIPNFLIGFNEDSIQWVENEDWSYQCEFNIDSTILNKSKVYLQFEGLDTYAGIYLNGNKIDTSFNMFVAKEIDVKSHLKSGNNILRIDFFSAVKKGKEILFTQPYILQIGNEPKPLEERTRVYTRKAPFQYGWDWGPRVVTCGIWRPVHLIAFNDFRISDVYSQTIEINKHKAELFISVDIESVSDLNNVELSFSIASASIMKKINLKQGINNTTFSVNIDNPKLWWCNGMGKPFLYNAKLDVKNKTCNLQHNEKIGIRTIELVQKEDSIGRSFYFSLNGVPVFSKGANYIPTNMLTGLQTEQSYINVVNNAIDANMNMLRIWGGGIYENDSFYDLCDEKGLMIWQDFMFACDMNPADRNHLENIKSEAVYNIKRLRNHPSIVLWCGNNENLLFYEKYGWKQNYNEQQRKQVEESYHQLFHEILPTILKKYDPELSYWPSSPQSYGNILPDRNSGDEHDWTVWFGLSPFEEFEQKVPRFCSEYGLQSYPASSIVKNYTPQNQFFDNSKMMIHRQKSKMDWIRKGYNGNDNMQFYTNKYYGSTPKFEDYLYLTQMTQAYGLKQAIEIHRRNMPRTMGSLYWQLNDCWPAPSWSTVDYYNNWKAAHYYVRKSFDKKMLSAKKANGKLQVFFISDEISPANNKVLLSFMTLDGKVLLSKRILVTNTPNKAQLVFDILLSDLQKQVDTTNCILKMSVNENYQNIALLAQPKLLQLTNTKISIKKTGNTLYLKSSKFSHGVYLSGRDKELKLSDNYFDLLPNETKVIKILNDIEFTVNDILIQTYNKLKTN